MDGTAEMGGTNAHGPPHLVDEDEPARPSMAILGERRQTWRPPG